MPVLALMVSMQRGSASRKGTGSVTEAGPLCTQVQTGAYVFPRSVIATELNQTVCEEVQSHAESETHRQLATLSLSTTGLFEKLLVSDFFKSHSI